MDVALLLEHTQYAVPVAMVLVCAVLVFVFGFKKAEQPPFSQLAAGLESDSKKAIAKKRSKTKEKVRSPLPRCFFLPLPLLLYNILF